MTLVVMGFRSISAMLKSMPMARKRTTLKADAIRWMMFGILKHSVWHKDSVKCKKIGF